VKLTKKLTVDIDTIVNDTKINFGIVKSILKKLQNNNLIIIKEKTLETSNYRRILLAIKAIELGADIENVTRLLHWKEFEGIAALALERNNFIVRKNFRFTYLKKRNEVDLIGLKKPIVLCVDCKHWHREVQLSSLKNIVSNQVRRTKDLLKFLPNISTKLECTSWEFGIFIPAVLTLVSNRQKFYDSVPIIPILQFQDFLNQLEGNMRQLEFFKKIFNHLPLNS
jgi:transcription initiation factor IIE alpha subunit